MTTFLDRQITSFRDTLRFLGWLYFSLNAGFLVLFSYSPGLPVAYQRESVGTCALSAGVLLAILLTEQVITGFGIATRSLSRAVRPGL